MRRALIVDDKPDNVYFLRALLEGHGWTVDEARHGAEALVKARARLPTVIVSDLLMPVMDGYTLLRHWRADERLCGVPFVVYTATYTEPEDEQLAYSLGADAFVLKPTEPGELLARIDRVLDGATPASPPHEPRTDAAVLARYSETLIRKLEEKTLQLQDANRALARDVAEREAIAATLREREALLRLAGGVARLGGWSLELPDHRVTWSDEVCAIHEVPAGTVPTAEEALAYYAPEDRDVFRRHVEACARDGVPFDVELQIVTATRRRVWVRAIGRAERDPSGAITRLRGAFQDVDDRRRLEERLRQAEKMEAVGRLAGGVAHDFNNLLSVILGYAELMLAELGPGAPLRAEAEEILRAGERAAELTRQLLAFGRHQVVQPRVLEVGQVVRGMEKMLRRLLGEDLELTILAPSAAARVHADRGQLEQVVLNLGVNARDAMPRGGTLGIEVTEVDLGDADAARRRGVPPGAYVVLAVTDTGVGMDAATRERIFEPFFTTKEPGKGTGLGLATVFGIVMQSRGHLRVHSEPGRGSTFEVYLPRCDHESESAGPPAPVRAAPGRGDETILLVEDEDQVRAMTRAILTRHGYTVLDAQNAGEALLICEQHPSPIHLLLTDVVMPRMSGRELAARLRPMRPGLRVLYTSGYADRSRPSVDALDAGAAFLPKPITPDALLCKVRDVLDAPPSARPPVTG